jgi:hypothetical protein
VCIPGTDLDADGTEDVCPSEDSWTFVSRNAMHEVAPLPTNATWDRSAPEIVAFDVDRDSKTLGAPLEYLESGSVQPIMVLRAPPVHFDVVDADGSGEISAREIYDVNNCFTDYLATGDSYTCDTVATYGSTTTVSSRVTGEVKTAASHTWATDFALTVGFDWNTLGCDGGGGEAVRPNPTDNSALSVGGTCVEASFFADIGGDSQQSVESERTIGERFSYASRVTANSGADLVYAGLQQNQVLEYPVYAGAGWGLGAGEPVQYLTQRTPLQTRFRWLSGEDFGFSLTGQGLVPQHVLSYAATEEQLQAQSPTLPVSSATVDGGTLVATLDVAHNLQCVREDPLEGVEQTELTINRVEKEAYGNTGIKDLNLFGKRVFPCVVTDTRVDLTGTRTTLDRGYLVVEALSANTLRLQPTTPLGPLSSSILGRAQDGDLITAPGTFPVDEWTVRRFRALQAEVITNRDSGFEESVGWGIGSRLSLGGRLGVATFGKYPLIGVGGHVGVSVGGNYSEEYTQDMLQTMTLSTTQDTSFGVRVTGDIDPGIAYSMKPYLVQSPGAAMVLDWTTSVDGTQQFWSEFYGQLPDPGFALPDLLTPYKAPDPVSNPSVTVPALLRSPDFGSWECDVAQLGLAGVTSFKECRAAPKAEPREPLLLVARVHNDSLKAYDGNAPIDVRFFVGDPARGGYEVARADAVTQRSPSCVSRFCLPARGETIAAAAWDWFKDAPGLVGQGGPARPLPMYAIIDADGTIAEGRDLVVPVDVRECEASYPAGDGAGGLVEDFSSACPATNNQAYFTQAFDTLPGGALAPSTDLRVEAADVRLLPDGSLTTTVRSTAASGRVQVRLYECATDACTPATTGKLLGTRTIPAIEAGGAVAARFAVPPGSGTRTFWVHAVPVDNWERPGGGPLDVEGQLENNLVKVVLPPPAV